MKFMQAILVMIMAGITLSVPIMVCGMLFKPLMLGTTYAPQTRVQIFTDNDIALMSGDVGVVAVTVIGVIMLILIRSATRRGNKGER